MMRNSRFKKHLDPLEELLVEGRAVEETIGGQLVRDDVLVRISQRIAQQREEGAQLV